MANQFATAITRCTALERQLRPGIQALKREDRSRIRLGDARRLQGSVALDDALRASLPNQPRWDYIVGATSAEETHERAHFVEVHPASASEIGAVEAKLRWVKEWVRTQARELDRMPRVFAWIASGKVSLSPQSPALRRLAMQGCKFVGRSYAIE